MIISFWRFVRFKTGGVVTSVQFIVLKSEFCCNAKPIEGMVQEMTALLSEGVRLNHGIGVVCEI
jgi:hypothetical protein